MISYHYFFIDAYFFNTPMWSFNFYLLEFIRFIFIGVSGFTLALSYSMNKDVNYFSKRLFKLGIVALLISVVTFFIINESFIYFGIIHLIFTANLLVFLSKFSKSYLLLPLLVTYLFPEIIHVKFLSLSTIDYFPLFPYIFYFIIPFFTFKFLKDLIPLKKPNYVSMIVKHSLLIYLFHPVVIFIYLHLYYKLI